MYGTKGLNKKDRWGGKNTYPHTSFQIHQLNDVSQMWFFPRHHLQQERAEGEKKKFESTYYVPNRCKSLSNNINLAKSST